MEVLIDGINIKDYISNITEEINNQELKEELKKLDFSEICFIKLDDIRKEKNPVCFFIDNNEKREIATGNKVKNLKNDLGLSFIKSFDFLVLKKNSNKIFFVEISDILGDIYSRFAKVISLIKRTKDKKIKKFLIKSIEKEIRQEFKEKLKDTLLFYYFLLIL